MGLLQKNMKSFVVSLLIASIAISSESVLATSMTQETR